MNLRFKFKPIYNSVVQFLLPTKSGEFPMIFIILSTPSISIRYPKLRCAKYGILVQTLRGINHVSLTATNLHTVKQTTDGIAYLH